MLRRAVWIPSELIARVGEAVDGDASGVRRGAEFGLSLDDHRPHPDAHDLRAAADPSQTGGPP